VGTSFAKALALGLQIPLIEVNHMQAHVLAHFIQDPKPSFPFLCLTVSGGHTQIVKVSSPLEMEVIGETKDDAVGEAFDKSAKLMGLPYPGGPLIDKHAAAGDPLKYSFPIPEIQGLDFSFSGIKTSFMYFLQKQTKANPTFIEEHLDDICASIQHTLIEILLKKIKKAARETGIKDIALAGGVSANSGLRLALQELGEKQRWNIFIPEFEYCTDNAAMIAMAAHYKYLENDFCDQTVSAMARMAFS
jgi:N6-L-threonylcarbamoyladenine synthase